MASKVGMVRWRRTVGGMLLAVAWLLLAASPPAPAQAAPVAVDDAYATLAGQPLTVPAPGVKGNDQNVGTLSAIRAGNAVGGEVTLNPDGSFTFTPFPEFSGTASFLYCLSAQFPNCASNAATVRITVTRPTAMDDSYSTLAGQPLTVPAPGVKANDQNVAPAMNAIRAGNAVGGEPTLNLDGSFTFTPTPGFSGAASFPYCLSTMFPNCHSNVATVRISVLTPIAVDDAYSTIANQVLTVPAPGVKTNDQNVAPAMNAIAAGPQVGGQATINADGSFTFTPTPGFSGAASFPYCLSTQFPNCQSNVATVRISVAAPVAVPDTYEGVVGQPLTVPAPGVRGNDQNVAPSLNAIRAGNAVGGEPVLNADGSFTFTPAANFVGQASFPYCLSFTFPNCLSNATSVTINYRKARPAISTQASPGNLLGAPVRDVATLTGGLSPTGTVTFGLFSDPACTTQVFQSTNPVSASTSTSDWFTPAASGTYYWTASYSGDASNEAVTSPCQAANEQVTIAPFAAPAFTRTITGDFLGPLTVNRGESVVLTNARVVGPVTVNPGGALTVVGSRISRGISADAPSFFSLCGTDVAAPAPGGTAVSVTNAAVPIRVGDPAAGCAGNRFAGQVSLLANLAVTFGANTVSHTATINGNGPGPAVVKANNVFQTLTCSGNNPAPTNAGQVNTAGSKTGQCAAL